VRLAKRRFAPSFTSAVADPRSEPRIHTEFCCSKNTTNDRLLPTAQLPLAPSFFQGFPNPSHFSPSFSKESFGGFVGFQRVATDPGDPGQIL
jgi:hypothetical protein